MQKLKSHNNLRALGEVAERLNAAVLKITKAVPTSSR